MTTVYESINYMEDWTLIAGGNWRINFNTFQEDGVTPLDMTSGTGSLRIAPLGDNENTEINLSGVFATPTDQSNGIWYVLLKASDTTGLSGVYTQQPRVIDSGGDIFLPSQGRVTILPENTL